MKRLFLSLLAATLFLAAGAQQPSVKDLELYAKSGNVEAMRQLGECYLNGTGVEKNEALGWQWLEKAADRGDAEAKKKVDTRNHAQKQQAVDGDFLKDYRDQQVRSLAYDMLHDKLRGNSQAANKLRALALDGNKEAILFMYNQMQLPASTCILLGDAFENGKKGLKKDLYWANLMYRRALYYSSRFNVPSYFNPTEEQKQAAAEGVMRMFGEGYGIAEKHLDLKGLREKADKGDAAACEWLGYYYYEQCDFYHTYIDGEALAPGADDCIHYYRKAAELKNANAMVSLGRLYQNYELKNLAGGVYYDWMELFKSSGLMEKRRARLLNGRSKEEQEKIEQALAENSPYKYYPRLIGDAARGIEAAINALSFPLFRDAAIAGNVEGMLQTGAQYESLVKYDDYFYRYGEKTGLANYEMARGWYAKAADKGSATGAGSMVRMAVARWEQVDKKAKEPDSTVVNYFKRIIADNDTTGIGPFLAEYSLGRLCYSLFEKTRSAFDNVKWGGTDALDYLRMAATDARKSKYPDVLSHAEYLIGNLAQAGQGDYYGFNDYENAMAWYDQALRDYPQTNKDSWRDDMYQKILKAKEECQNELKDMTDEDRDNWQKARLRAQALRNQAAGLDMRLIENNFVWDYTKGPDPAGNPTWHPNAAWEIDGVRWWKAHGFDPNKPITRTDMITSAYKKGKFAGQGRGYADWKNGLRYDPQKMCPTSSNQVMVGTEEEFQAYVRGYLAGYKQSYVDHKPF